MPHEGKARNKKDTSSELPARVREETWCAPLLTILLCRESCLLGPSPRVSVLQLWSNTLQLVKHPAMYGSVLTAAPARTTDTFYFLNRMQMYFAVSFKYMKMVIHNQKINYTQWNMGYRISLSVQTCSSVRTALCLLLHSIFSTRVFNSAKVLSNTAHWRAHNFSSSNHCMTLKKNSFVTKGQFNNNNKNSKY